MQSQATRCVLASSLERSTYFLLYELAGYSQTIQNLVLSTAIIISPRILLRNFPIPSSPIPPSLYSECPCPVPIPSIIIDGTPVRTWIRIRILPGPNQVFLRQRLPGRQASHV